jgi:hypothetical protein
MTISPAEQAERAELEHNIRQHEELLLHLPDAVVEIDFDSWNVVSASRIARILLGYLPDIDPAPFPALGHIGEADRARVLALTNEQIAESRANHSPYERVANPATYDVTLCRVDGATFPAAVTIFFILDTNRVPVRGYIVFRDITERRRMESERMQLLLELQETLANLEILSGLLPICAICKDVRDDSGYWVQIESYVRKHSDADFQHGLCDACREELYRDSRADG